MTSLRYACCFSVLISISVLAQSTQTVPIYRRNRSTTTRGRTSRKGRTEAAPTSSPRHQTTPLQSGLNFAPAVTYSSGGMDAESVVAADLNGDGKPDLVVAHNEDVGLAGVLLNSGNGTFQAAVTYPSGGNDPFSIAVADVNSDGKPDLIVLNQSDPNCVIGSAGVLLGNGDGTFQPVVTYCTGGIPGGDAVSVAVADVNGDGKPDLIVLNDDLVVLLGNGDGTFQTAMNAGGAVGYNASSLTVADVNGDGKPDVLIATCEDTFCSEGNVIYVNLGNGNGTFVASGLYETGGGGGFLGAYSVAVADVNGDGKLDLMVANICNTRSCNSGDESSVGVLLGNGNGSFQPVVTYASGGFDASSVAVGDVNGDEIPDIIVANECGLTSCLAGAVGALLGNGDGTFQAAVTFASGVVGPDSVTVEDLNGDGKPDVAMAGAECDCQNGAVGVLINISVTPTATALTSSQNPSSFGEPVTFTATVTPQFGQGVPTGTVGFFDGGSNIGNSHLNGSGMATLTTSSLSVGTHTITATYNGDANFGTSTSAPLYQVVQGAIATLSPSGLNFGNQTVGIPSTSQNVMLSNTGNINLVISMIQINRANMGDFSQNNNCPASLAPNGSCSIAVTFKPTTTGTRNAAVSVTDNAPNSPQSASLMGVGVLPAVMFSPTSLTFGTQIVYTTSPPQKVTLTNTGLGILEIKSAKISSQFGVTTTCGKTLASGASCTAEVKFRPTTKGQISGSITLTDNAPDSPQQVPLSGTGTFVDLTPASLNFGTQPINTTSPPKYITLENKGTGPVNFTGSGITITGADPGDFAQQNNCPNSLPSGSYCTIKVSFTPTQQGKRTADVSVSDDGGGSPQMVPLTGTGTP